MNSNLPCSTQSFYVAPIIYLKKNWFESEKKIELII